MWYDDIDIDLLPEPYSDIKNIIGAKNTLKLLQLQGRAFYFNTKLNMLTTPINEIVSIIGDDMTELLKKHYGREYVYFKKVDDILRNIRNEKIYKEFDGNNFGDLCHKYNLTEQQIRNILTTVRSKKMYEKHHTQLSFLD